MKLIVGLGNPGPKYQLNRHNIGFLLIDSLVERFSNDGRSYKTEFKAETKKVQIQNQPVLLCKPQTFMNLSGESVQPLMKFYNIALDDLLVAHDEIDLPFGAMKFQVQRSAGGHNGIKSLHQMLGSDNYARLRLGVGRPPSLVNDDGEKIRPALPVHEWVLQDFSAQEQNLMPEFIELAHKGLDTWIHHGLAKASTLFNNRTLENKNSPENKKG